MSGRPLLAAPPKKPPDSSSSGPWQRPWGQSDLTHFSGQGYKPARTLIESACVACRRRKSKCDGLRPTCTRCQILRTECQFEAEEGESRWSALRRRCHALESECQDLRELVRLLQSLPDANAYALLHRVRLTDYDQLPALIRHSQEYGVDRPPPTTDNSPPPAEAQLPPIRAMLETASISPSQLHVASSAAGPSSRPFYPPTYDPWPPAPPQP